MVSDTQAPRVVIDLPKRFAVGITTDFSVSFKPGNQAGRTVLAQSSFPDGSYTAWWYDGSEWQEYSGDGSFGGTGFPLQEATSYFRVRFEEPMVSPFSVKMVDALTGEVLASDVVTASAVVGETIDEFNARVANGGLVELATDIAGQVSIGRDVTIVGNGCKLHGNISLDATSDTLPYTVSISDLIIDNEDGSSSSGYGIIGMNQTADTPVKPVNLSLRDCVVRNQARKGVYVTNVRSLNVTNCLFMDVATADMDSPNTYGDYGIDVNLCGVQNAAIRIVDNTFSGICGSMAAIKVTQRAGQVSSYDDNSTDILNTTVASIASCVIAGNDFSGVTAEGAVHIAVGDNTNSDGTMRSYCASYPISVTAYQDGETTVMLRGATGQDLTFTLPAGGTYESSGVADGDGTYTIVVGTSVGTTYTGTAGDNISMSVSADWVAMDNGPCGIGMLGFRRLILFAEAVTYATGGLEIPYSFRPVAVLVNADGGADARYDPATDRVLLYRSGAEVDSGTELTNVTLLMFGR